MKRLLVLLFGLILLPSTVFAVDISGNYAVWGLGKKSCFGFQQAAAAEKIDDYENYMKGFLTAYNIFTEKTYSISGKMNQNQIVEWLVAYCEENPMSSFENALTSFTFDHYDNRMKSTNSSSGR